MFCPKCGKELPDGAQFCGSCGNKITTAPQPAYGTVQPGYGSTPQLQPTALAGSFSTVALAALAATVLAIIFLFLPWIKIPLLESGNALANNIFGSTGASALQNSIPSSFNLWGIGDALSQLASLAGMAGANASDLASVSASAWMIRIYWLALVILLIVGIVMAVLGRGTKFLRVVALCITALALTWIVTWLWFNSTIKSATTAAAMSAAGSYGGNFLEMAGLASSDYVKVPIWPYFTALAAFAAFFLADMDARAKGLIAGIEPLALGSLLCAFTGIGLVGLVGGIFALRRHNAQPVKSANKTLAIVAIVIGAISLLITLVSVVMVGSALKGAF